ncbi:MerR family transcriptional regulator [Streptomyces scabiei]|uniref:MerR family transcriptional regulator n=1 Tax=Streptomyces scabiei TaxID=1930 RepID=UPI0029BB1DA5|nr:MerR family transcriptional regulator [Streptomyces scabiei]MDX3170090.1 MerR family transcriptional regulator [Streptomyces scabiei]
MPDLYTGTQAAQLATRWRRTVSAGAAAVTRSAVSNWVARGHLKPAGLDEYNRPLFALPDIARAELATRSRALRLVGIGSTTQETSRP